MLILNPSGTEVVKEVKLPAVPHMLAITGLFNVEYRIAAICRGGLVYNIKVRGLLSTMVLHSLVFTP